MSCRACSVAATWCFPDEKSPHSDRVLSMLNDRAALVPELFWMEIRNILLVNERHGRIQKDDSDAFLRMLSRLPLQTRSNAVGSSIMDLGRRHSLSSYDARYLELALDSQSPLATLDQRLASAAQAEGLNIVAQ